MTMQPHSLSTAEYGDHRTRAQKLEAFPFSVRHGRSVPKGTVLPETIGPAIDPNDGARICPRVKVADLPDRHIPQRYFEALEHNQQIASCCRHPENHDIEGLKSHPDEKSVDIYVLHCACGRKHRRLCVGFEDKRPEWKAA